MSNAAFSVVYGVPLPDGRPEAGRGCWEGEPGLRYCGVVLDTFDECGIRRLAAVEIVPTPDDLAAFDKKFARVPTKLRAACDSPEVLLVPYTV